MRTLTQPLHPCLSRCHPRSSQLLQRQLPSLPHKVLPKTMMRRFTNQTKPGSLINPMRPNKNALRPQNHLLIPCRPRKTNAFLHQSISKTHPPRTRFDKQQPQLRGIRLLRMLHEKDVPNALTINLRNPAAFPARIEVRDELIDNARHQSLKGLVPSILLRIANTLAMDDPAHIQHD